jgi:hypothetical protein
MTDRLLRALLTMLPNAEICMRSERLWRSLNFSGTQLELSATVSSESHSEMAAEFEQMLSDHDFHSGDQFVADIAVTKLFADDTKTHLVIHALLLDT